ncbi:DUF2383 domain-containing protein [Lacinutrix sp. 5H-3-7-4]|uniref:DUF2383 domain-containing protein n=1 Tax=Lacinutrix sp. (strain 5H-3-7-4) TaxID=983544 RepID=UPI00020A3AFD|nr:DUF2383 domain-containing protein [Lacinutrix sp. 5H-3-7-4]AEH00498.1 hypothetical protein Lacal_0648 [Lacinutrix sp. 5H-3-7-4]
MSNTITYQVGAEALQNALRASHDAESAYEQLLQKSNNDAIKNFIKERISMFNQFSEEISDLLMEIGVLPQEKGSVNGGLSRLWFDLKSSVLDYNINMLLEESKKIDKDHHYNYMQIIRSNSYSQEAYEVLMNHLSEIRTTKRPEVVSSHPVIKSVQVRA